MSQEYTPVDWVDETTSQQGTLINAERLTQMQTAHHYADGFEEVDAIPTEDPGVDYHKMVYCTADATFYRWDGEVWTADIDEDTKHLLDQEIARAEHAEGLIQGYLDAHEANHNNPHQVTKAQVGLGNCDNTADLDKPISTAAQAALDTKADKATTLAGYGITDAYTKAQADTLLADKADKADVYDKTAADTLLAGKVDKLVSSPAGTYKSVTVNAQGQVTAGTNPDTLAGYGITDAYTKTQTDTLLATKADTTALTDGSVTKVGTADLGTDTKPIKLVAGVPTAVTDDLVSTSGNQDIAGSKTFTDTAIFNHDDNNIILANPNYTSGTNPSSNKYNGILFRGSTPTTQGWISHVAQTDGSTKFQLRTYNMAQAFKQVEIYTQADNNGYVTIPNRAYNANNTSDAVNIALLDAYPAMVRTSGNQTIGGLKSLTTGSYIFPIISIPSTIAGYVKMASIKAGGSPRTIHGTLTSTYQATTTFHIEFWLSNWNNNSIGFAKTKSINADNSRLRVTVKDGIWEIWTKVNENSTNSRALLYFNEIIFSNVIASDAVTPIPQTQQVLVPTDDPSWSDYTIITLTEF